MKLKDLAPVEDDSHVTGFALDHRKVVRGNVFGAFRGAAFNGEDFIDGAVKHGAIAVVAAIRPETRMTLVETPTNYLQPVPGDLRELPPPISAQARQAHLALLKLLEDDDSQAMVVWQHERSVFRDSLPSLIFNRLNAAMDRCDFESALNLLKEGIHHAHA